MRSTRLSTAVLSVLVVVVCASKANAQRSVSTQHIQVDNWVFIPTLYDGTVETLVALRTDTPEGGNITSMWFILEADNTWTSYGWTEQNRSKTVGYVKTALQIPNAHDGSWTVTPIAVDPSELPPRTMVRGVFVDDPFAGVVASAADPDEILDFLVAIGWSAAHIDIWNVPCTTDTVLNTYSLAVEATEIEIAANGGTNPRIEATFTNTVSQPCGGGECTWLIDGQVTLVSEGDPGSIIAVGVVPDGAGQRFMEAAVIAPGQVLIHGSIKNTGTQPAVLLLQNGHNVPVAAGQEVALVETNNQCYDQCSRIVGWVHDPGFGPRIPIRCLDNKCYCCCWAGLQPIPPTWLQGLPACPCQITFDQDGNPVNPDGWRDPYVPDQTYHPGAAFCMRSNCPAVNGGPGQQCCYDAAGNLITVGGGAGTPDMVAPCGPWDAWVHHDEDVKSYNRCNAAGMLDCYLFHRPPNNGNGCTCNPPNHAHCTTPPSAASCNCP